MKNTILAFSLTFFTTFVSDCQVFSTSSSKQESKLDALFWGDRIAIVLDASNMKGVLIEKSNGVIKKYNINGELLSSRKERLTLVKKVKNEINDINNDILTMKSILNIECKSWSLDSFSAKCSLEVCKWFKCLLKFDCSCEGGNNESGCRNTMCFYCFAQDGCPSSEIKVIKKEYFVRAPPERKGT